MIRGLARSCLVTGGLFGAVAVATGAFGAHGLAARLDASGQAANWETASRYALVHALALVAVGIAAAIPAGEAARRPLAAAAWCFGIGVAVFSGCLWALALSGVKMLGAIVPIGGSLLIAGWVLFALAGSRVRDLAQPGTR